MDKQPSLCTMYVVARMSARDIYDRRSVSPGGGAQNNASRAYQHAIGCTRRVRRDSPCALRKNHVCPADVHNEFACRYTARAVDPWVEFAAAQLRSHAGDGGRSCACISSRMEISPRAWSLTLPSSSSSSSPSFSSGESPVCPPRLPSARGTNDHRRVSVISLFRRW